MMQLFYDSQHINFNRIDVNHLKDNEIEAFARNISHWTRNLTIAIGHSASAQSAFQTFMDNLKPIRMISLEFKGKANLNAKSLDMLDDALTSHYWNRIRFPRFARGDIPLWRRTWSPISGAIHIRTENQNSVANFQVGSSLESIRTVIEHRKPNSFIDNFDMFYPSNTKHSPGHFDGIFKGLGFEFSAAYILRFSFANADFRSISKVDFVKIHLPTIKHLSMNCCRFGPRSWLFPFLGNRLPNLKSFRFISWNYDDLVLTAFEDFLASLSNLDSIIIDIAKEWPLSWDVILPSHPNLRRLFVRTGTLPITHEDLNEIFQFCSEIEAFGFRSYGTAEALEEGYFTSLFLQEWRDYYTPEFAAWSRLKSLRIFHLEEPRDAAMKYRGFPASVNPYEAVAREMNRVLKENGSLEMERVEFSKIRLYGPTGYERDERARVRAVELY